MIKYFGRKYLKRWVLYLPFLFMRCFGMKVRIVGLILSIALIFSFCSCGKDEEKNVSSVTSEVGTSELKIGECTLIFPSNWQSQTTDTGEVATIVNPQDDGFADNIFIITSTYDHMLIYYTKEQFQSDYEQMYSDAEILEFDTSMQLGGNYTVFISGRYTDAASNLKISFNQYIFNYGEAAYSFVVSSNEEEVPQEINDVVRNMEFE